MECFESAKESNITYFLQGQTRLKKQQMEPTTTYFINKYSIIWSNRINQLAKHLGQTFGQGTGQAFGQAGQVGPMAECSFSK